MIPAQQIIDSLSQLAVFGVAAIIFFETATILGSFLPGDSLLFILGLSMASLVPNFPFWLALLIVLLAAIAGAQTGFWVGKKTGPALFRRETGLIFHKDTPARVRGFFDKYGPRAIVLARFIPVLRALIPMFVAIAGFDAKRFFRLNVIGGAIWVIGLMSTGYLLGHIPFVENNIEAWVIGFVILSSAILPIELIREKIRQRAVAERSS